MSSEKVQKEEKVLYPKVDEVQGTNPPTAAAHGEAQEKFLKDENVLYPQVEEVQPVQATNLPMAEHGESDQESAKWGTHIMGAPADPSAHPQNQEAATWKAGDEENENNAPNPYLMKGEPPPSSKNPMELVLHSFTKWRKEAENLASNLWTNLNTGKSVPDAAWGKVSLGAKALKGGGFESLFKQTFPVETDEKLRKAFASYLSTSTGAVAGTLYVSTVKIAFCSDRPLSYTVPSGEEGWSYYKIAIPLVKLKAVNHSANKDNPPQKYIQVETVDGHEFWFMGFVNYEKALSTLRESISGVHSATPHH